MRNEEGVMQCKRVMSEDLDRQMISFQVAIWDRFKQHAAMTQQVNKSSESSDDLSTYKLNE